MRKSILTLTALAASTAAVPAMAQDARADHFNGPYISIVGDHSMQESDGDETLLFDESPELYLWLGSDTVAME